jgi:short-subunit dehydrogenase
MDDVVGKWALVTGASSGFGVEFATLLAARSANQVLVARRKEPMEELADTLRRTNGVQVIVEPADLSIPGAAAELRNRIDRRGLDVDVLVNNAGRGLNGDFLDQPLETSTAMVNLNLMAVTELTYLFAQHMVKRKTGHILLIASLLGYQPTPGYAVYGATKAYVLLLGGALHAELKKHNVNVTVLSPRARRNLLRARRRPETYLRCEGAHDGAPNGRKYWHSRHAAGKIERSGRAHEQVSGSVRPLHSAIHAGPDHADSA